MPNINDLINQAASLVNDSSPIENVQDGAFLEDYVMSQIINPSMSTLALSYDNLTNHVIVQIITGNANVRNFEKKEFEMLSENYEKMCSSMFKIDMEARFNDSSSLTLKGVPTRVFALMPPFSKYPLITISTAKKPPAELIGLNNRQEDILKKIINENFIVCGKSGAGKTYLLNYLLSKYYPKTSRLLLIQEFAEIFPPNDFTTEIMIPPRKPGENYNSLEFVLAQTNLMRGDQIGIGEIKSSEAFDFVIQLGSGSKGFATMHGDTPQLALQRLRLLCQLSKSNIDARTIEALIMKALQYVIQVDSGKVKEIDKIVSCNNGNFSFERIDSPNSDLF